MHPGIRSMAADGKRKQLADHAGEDKDEDPPQNSNELILIVEDEVMVATALKRLIEITGRTVCGIASTADEAVKLADEHKPKIVMLDIRLPGALTGVEAALEIQKSTDCQFIVMTGNPMSAKDLPFEPLAIVPKPYKFQDIVDLIS